jgi:hypothetical protein
VLLKTPLQCAGFECLPAPPFQEHFSRDLHFFLSNNASSDPVMNQSFHLLHYATRNARLSCRALPALFHTLCRLIARFRPDIGQRIDFQMRYFDSAAVGKQRNAVILGIDECLACHAKCSFTGEHFH